MRYYYVATLRPKIRVIQCHTISLAHVEENRPWTIAAKGKPTSRASSSPSSSHINHISEEDTLLSIRIDQVLTPHPSWVYLQFRMIVEEKGNVRVYTEGNPPRFRESIEVK